MSEEEIPENARISKNLKIIEVNGEALISLEEPILSLRKRFPFSEMQDEKQRQYMASIQEELKERMKFMPPMGFGLPFDLFTINFKISKPTEKEEDDCESE